MLDFLDLTCPVAERDLEAVAPSSTECPHCSGTAAWGFSYRRCLTWIKPRFGLGHYLRNQTEHLLFGVRGRAPVLFKGQGTWTYAPLQEHSHNPEEQYAIIERLR